MIFVLVLCSKYFSMKTLSHAAQSQRDGRVLNICGASLYSSSPPRSKAILHVELRPSM